VFSSWNIIRDEMSEPGIENNCTQEFGWERDRLENLGVDGRTAFKRNLNRMGERELNPSENKTSGGIL
jgi:hypothetical protein